jgi:peptidoglycan-associated lipoprotein
MKHLVFVALLASLLAGCSDAPIQDATIEDRAVASKDAKKAADDKAAAEVAAKQAAAVQAAKAAQAAQDAEKAKAAAKPADKVETRGVAAPDAEVKSLDGSQVGAKGPDGKPIGAAGQAGIPLLDPKNPASPLAQRRILFDYDSAAIRDEYRSLLEAHAQYMKKEKTAKAILQGHADERGSREYNLALGQRRSESVYKALNLLGVPDTQIEAVSLGEEKPVAEGHDEEAWKQNRRAEILYQGE